MITLRFRVQGLGFRGFWGLGLFGLKPPRSPRPTHTHTHTYTHTHQLPVWELAAGVRELPTNVRLLLQRTTFLAHPSRGEETNKEAFKELLGRVTNLHLRACLNLVSLPAGLASSSVLKVLSIAYCMLDDEALMQEMMSAIGAAGTLQCITLRACFTAALLSRTLPPILDVARSSASLIFLDLSGNSLGDAGVSKISSDCLPQAQALESLVLDENNISDQGATKLGHSLRQHKQTTLQHLSLASNSIQTEGAQYLASCLCTNSTLQSLNLSSNWILDQGLLMLSNALMRNTTLRSLRVASNGVTDDSIRSSKGMSHALSVNLTLKILDLDQNALKPAAQDEFVARIRECNTGLTLLNIGSNTHFFRRETGASILAAVQMPTRRRFGDRMVERRLKESALIEQNIHDAKMEKAKTELENALNLPDGHSLASGNAELEQLFMTFCASGKGFAGKGKRGSSMDLTELQKLLTHLKILPAVKGGCGYVTKTKSVSDFENP